MELQGFDEVRWFVHEVIADDARLGYEFDMAWRGLTEVARRDVVLPEGGAYADIREAVGAFVDMRFSGQRNRLWEDPKVVHLVYVVTEEEILRWTRVGESVVREKLEWEPDRMRATAARALRGLSTAPAADDAGVSEDLQAPLEELCGRLVPAWLIEDGGEVWISADDALTQLPFVTFDRDEGEGMTL